MENSALTRSRLKAMAVSIYGLEITPCVNKRTLDDCFSVFCGKLVFWFNTPDHSTHVVSLPVEEEYVDV